MTIRELAKRMFYSFFIIFCSAIIAAYFVVQIFADSEVLSIRGITSLLIITILTNLTHFVLYSKKPLSTTQLVFRYLIIAFLVVIIVLAVTIYFNWTNIVTAEHFTLLVVIPITLLIVVAIIVMHLIFANNSLKATLRAQEREYYYYQCQRMQESVEQTKAIQHDMKFHLITARNLTANNQAEEATTYLDGILGDVAEFKIYSDTGNVIFDSMINYKLSKVKNDDIKLDVRVYVPTELNIEVTDMVIILGNLLDNAIDSVANVEDKMITIDIEFNKNSLFIKIENTYDGIIKYSKGKSTGFKYIETRKSGENHGHGLKNIKRAVEKYDGHMNISHTDTVFSVGVLLYVEDTLSSYENGMLSSIEHRKIS